MIRLFGSDILHTWVLGFVECCVGFSLQIIKYIGFNNVDKKYTQSPKRILEIIKKFPAYNSLQPVRRHVMFDDIWDICIALSSKKASNPKNITGMIKMREKIKLVSALFQIYFALADSTLLPTDMQWCRRVGFNEPYFCPRQIVINALNAVLEVHWYLKAGSLTEVQLITLQMLIANAQAHMLVLDVMRKRIIEMALSTKENFEDVNVQKIGLMNNVKFELISHLVESMRQCGCDNNARDTEHGERFMKICKLLFADTTRRYHTVLKDMLRKFLHLEYMYIAQKGFEDANVASFLPIADNKRHNKSVQLTSYEDVTIQTNNRYRKQTIVFRVDGFKTKCDGSNWLVHPMLKMVSKKAFHQCKIF
jgi:hypothetical protein